MSNSEGYKKTIGVLCNKLSVFRSSSLKHAGNAGKLLEGILLGLTMAIKNNLGHSNKFS